MSKSWWVAVARGADFKDLRAKGFRVFYPVLDDYVFLEECDENKKLLIKQEELKVKFLRDPITRVIQKVTDAELSAMTLSTQDSLVPGQDILVVEGYGSGLEGKILSREGESITCEVYGYKRIFSLELTMIQVVKRGVTPSTELPPDEGML